MSNWTYVQGMIKVSPLGRTQAEKTYILNTILDHLPIVEGSEGDMETYVIQKNGHDMSSSSDEFGLSTNNLVDDYDCHNRKRGWMRVQSDYFVVVDGSLRDTEFEDTYKSFINWLCRLSKRIKVWDIMVNISDYDKKVFINDSETYQEMFEHPSWGWGAKEGDENWCEYLMWDAPRDDEGNNLCGKPMLEDLKRGRFMYDE